MIIEKDGQIIVTELRPMSEFQYQLDDNGGEKLWVEVLVKPKNSDGFRVGLVVGGCVRLAGEPFPFDCFEGYILLPIYQPQQKQEPVYLECGE